MTPLLRAAAATLLLFLAPSACAQEQNVVLRAPERVSVLNWVPAALHARIADRTASADVSDAIQAALDKAPVGATLVFPAGDYRLERPVVLRRKVHIEAYGARLIGAFGANVRDSLLSINVEDADNRDDRAHVVRGLTAFFASGGRHVIHITNRPPNKAHIGLVIEHCNLSARDDGEGFSVAIEGFGNQHNYIQNCQLNNGVYLACTDGTKIVNNSILGFRGVLIALYEGAFRTSIADNSIATRDYGVLVRQGSQIDIERNQFEQPLVYRTNRSAAASTVVLQGTAAHVLHNIRIVANNFGGGLNQAQPLALLAFAEDTFIDQNVFYFGSSGRDIAIAAPTVKWTRIGPNNGFRGRRDGTDPADPLQIADAGLGTYGVWKGADAFALGAGWRASPGFRFKKTLDDIVKFEGRLTGAGGTMGRLPEGFRPRSEVALALPDAARPDTLARLAVAADGAIRAVGALPGAAVEMSGVQLPVQGRTSYRDWPG